MSTLQEVRGRLSAHYALHNVYPAISTQSHEHLESWKLLVDSHESIDGDDSEYESSTAGDPIDSIGR